MGEEPGEPCQSGCAQLLPSPSSLVRWSSTAGTRQQQRVLPATQQQHHHQLLDDTNL